MRKKERKGAVASLLRVRAEGCDQEEQLA
eukprot:COSAG06_NODE_66612_length_254_cov_0.535484_1_plen_28_part_01